MAKNAKMAEVSIRADDVKRLGIKLMGLQHALTSEERAILWSALAVAADALSHSGGGPGQAPLVKEVNGVGDPVVRVNGELSGPDLGSDFPDLLAEAFHPERQPDDRNAPPRSAGQDPRGRGDTARKIGGLVGGVEVPSGRPDR